MSMKSYLCSNYRFTSLKIVSTANAQYAPVQAMIVLLSFENKNGKLSARWSYLCYLPKFT